MTWNMRCIFFCQLEIACIGLGEEGKSARNGQQKVRIMFIGYQHDDIEKIEG
jgi:hypothetical protein